MRSMTTNQIAALDSIAVRSVLFVHLELESADIRLCNAGHNITWDGYNWIGFGLLAGCEAIKETSSPEAVGLKLTLASPDPTTVSLALQENPQNRPCRVYLGLYNDSWQLIDTPTLECEGLIDRFTMAESPTRGTQIASGIVEISVENELVDIDRPRIRRMTDADQQRIYPGDRFFEYVSQMTERVVVWPARSFG